MTAVMLHLVRQIDSRGIPAAQGTPRTAMWLRERLLVGQPAARRLVQLAKAVDDRPHLDQALSGAGVNVDQAAAIAASVNALTTDLGAEVADKAEAIMLEWAATLDPHQIGTLGRRVLEYVAPDVAEAAERRAVEHDTATAHAARTLSIRAAGDGRVRLTAWLDTEAAAVISAALDPLCSPRRRPDPSRGAGLDTEPDDVAAASRRDAAIADDRTAGQRRVDALVEVCRLALCAGDLPGNGGDRPQLSVTMRFDELRDQVGFATLDSGERLTPAQARRLACDAQVLPAVLGSQGQVLDVGQSRRLITGALRRALVLRDGGCAFPACDRPPRWAEGHHIRSWIDGGPTSLDNSVLLCGPHHRVVHHTAWTVRLARDGRPEFIPPVSVDLEQRPRRNLYHRRT